MTDRDESERDLPGRRSPRPPDENVIVDLAGIPFENTNLDEAVAALLSRLQGQNADALTLRFANASCVVEAQRNSSYRELLTAVGTNYPDGAPVAYYLRRLAKTGGRRPGRVRGPSFFECTLDRGREDNTRHFFLGTTEATLNAMTSQATSRWPGVVIAGCYAPPYAPVDDAFIEGCVAAVSSADADIVWVGLGSPKQDFVATQITRRTGIATAGVGAAFDFVAGTVSPAPVWMQNSGLEWVYRLVREPRRLWKRYIFGNVAFLICCERFILRRRRTKGGRRGID